MPPVRGDHGARFTVPFEARMAALLRFWKIPALQLSTPFETLFGMWNDLAAGIQTIVRELIAANCKIACANCKANQGTDHFGGLAWIYETVWSRHTRSRLFPASCYP